MTTSQLQVVDANRLKEWIHDDDELALLDVREHGQYGENHLFFAVSVPYSELELKVGRLVPQKSTRLVIYGDSSTKGVVGMAATILLELGYTEVYTLAEGIEDWQRAGYSVFSGVHLPSKTFGELVEQMCGTPSISADKLYERLNTSDQNIVVLDGRPIHEYRKMNIPGAVCCPNGELALRIDDLVPDASTTIVVNCAGRTRGIIGAQTLINLGLPNEIYALENGTQGWYLHDLPLEHASGRVYPREIDGQYADQLRERSDRLARRFALVTVDTEQLRKWFVDDKCNVFVCDVRTTEEYLKDDIPAFIQHAPGGQLIQATDKYVGVRKAKIILYDSDGIRAPVVASWLKQLGWEVYLLADLNDVVKAFSSVANTDPKLTGTVLPNEAIKGFITSCSNLLVLDARPSHEFKEICVAHSRWVVRPTLLQEAGCDHEQAILILGDDIGKLTLLCNDLKASGFSNVYISIMDTEQLSLANLPLRPGGGVLADEQCIDYLFFVHDRHDGNKEAARKYLAWETNLVSKLDERERDTFTVGTQTET